MSVRTGFCKTHAQATAAALAVYEARVLARSACPAAGIANRVDDELHKIEHVYWNLAVDLKAKRKAKR